MQREKNLRTLGVVALMVSLVALSFNRVAAVVGFLYLAVLAFMLANDKLD